MLLCDWGSTQRAGCSTLNSVMPTAGFLQPYYTESQIKKSMNARRYASEGPSADEGFIILK